MSEAAGNEAVGGDVSATADTPTKQRLLASAVELMASHGSIEPVSLRAVAGATGVSPTAVYRHFADKEALIDGAIDWAWAEFDRALSSAAKHGVDPHDCLKRQGIAYVHFAQKGVYSVLFGHPITGSRAQTELGFEVFDKLVALVGDVLEANADARPSSAVGTSLFTATHGIAHLRLVMPDFPWPPLEDQIAELLEQLRLTPVA